MLRRELWRRDGRDYRAGVFKRKAAPSPSPAATPAPSEPLDIEAITASMPAPWGAILRSTLDDMEAADPLYRPTSFWDAGFDTLVRDIGDRGLETFKSWPSAAFFFYPRYGQGFTDATLARAVHFLRELNPRATEAFIHRHLVDACEVNRDIDVVLAMLDRDRLPIDVEHQGESVIGSPPQRYRPFGAGGPTVGRPYTNYLKILAAVSRVIDRELKSVLEIGSGFGVLGEILRTNDPTVQYVNVDIPPLSTVAHYYLSSVFPTAPMASALDLRDGSTFELGAGQPCGSFSSWQLPQLVGSPDMCINAFSFQEMEPAVVENYAVQIARLSPRYVVSLNSRAGKPLKANSPIGVERQVKSDSIVESFAVHGYRPWGRFGRPAAPPQAELIVLGRD